MVTARIKIPSELMNATPPEQTMEVTCSSATLVHTYTLKYNVTNEDTIYLDYISLT
jgi:hypothetical protein